MEDLKAIERAVGKTDGHEDLADQVYRNAVVYAQAREPSEEVLKAFEGVGLAIYRIANRKKSFIVGDVPGARAQIQAFDSCPTLFLPLTHGIAVGHVTATRSVEVMTVDSEQVRRMNVASTKRSTTIAGRSSELIASLSRSVIYRGIMDVNQISIPVEQSQAMPK